jgi:dihydrofolate synthase/folylpolyglutamate synthase
MNYKETTEWMFGQLPMYQNQGASAYKADLSNTLVLVNHLNNPQKYFKSVHVAGTNGKGSVSSMLASILQEAGYKVGLFTSPHLKDYRERIRINGREIEEHFVVDFIADNKDFFESNKLSFFEMSTGLAFSYFAKEKVDIAIIEVGMGGRLDSTNVIEPLVSVITNIGIDHKQFLGDTLGKIAYEKSGIIKPHIPVVIGETNIDTKPIFVTIAKLNKAEVHYAETKVFPNFECELKGDYQKQNIKTVLTVISLLHVHFSISKQAIENGLLHVTKNTGLKGRWQIINESPKVIADTAHNVHGLTIVLNQLQKLKYKQLHIIIGVVNDKEIDDILSLFPNKANYYFCKANIERGLDANILQEKAHVFGLKGGVYSSVNQAYNIALKVATKEDVIFIGGSTFTVAEIL